jgi:hypothetical protein
MNHFSHWKVYYSSLIDTDTNYLQDVHVKDWLHLHAHKKEDLHLAVSVRSFRSEKLSEFIHSVLEKEFVQAKNLYTHYLKETYPIYLTRDFEVAKQWLKTKSIGSERSGIVASSGAYRLRPFGINVKNKINAPIWFLNDKDDIRSSYFNEEVATEFDIQGLELDWSCVCWDGDFYFDGEDWQYRKFKGTKWQQVKQNTIKRYLLNAYRVLLTRARQGMIIFIPCGSKDDKTRSETFYDRTFSYLAGLGIEEI